MFLPDLCGPVLFYALSEVHPETRADSLISFFLVGSHRRRPPVALLHHF